MLEGVTLFPQTLLNVRLADGVDWKPHAGLAAARQGCGPKYVARHKEQGKMPPRERIVSFNGAYSLDQIQSRMARIDWTIVPAAKPGIVPL